MYEILEGLKDVVLKKFSNVYDYVEIKLFSGLKLSSKYISSKDSKSNLCKNGNIKSDELLYLDAQFSKDFKNKINRLHKEYK